MALYNSGDTLGSVARTVAGQAEAFESPLSDNAVFSRFHVAPDTSLESILAQTFQNGDLEFLRNFLNPLPDTAGPRDTSLAEKLSLLSDHPSQDSLEIAADALLYKEEAAVPFGAKIGKIPTLKTQRTQEVASKLDRFNAISTRVETGFQTLLSLEAAKRTIALHRFAEEFLPAYAEAKQAHGYLDFDDLIRRTRDLLASPSLAWILYRLDGQIDHILVDEAQDTSPSQWRIVQALTDAMADHDDRKRTLFVVGDKKQSIYSFQGADAKGFDRNQQAFDQQLQGRLRDRELLHSFRSSSAILSLVDAVTEPLDGLGSNITHHAFHGMLAGRVDLWPLIPYPTDPDEPAWYDPVDRPVDNAASVELGRMVADQIRRLLETETISDKNGNSRPVTAGDIMILVQRRSAIFDQIIQACKAMGLPIAGSDRLKIGGELAVRDLLALMSFLDLPEDDLSLAASLRSPLFGWSERDLYQLAAKRSEDRTLWAELFGRQEDFPDTVATLVGLLRQVDFLRPYELLEQILNMEGGRIRLLARLGPEAQDGIDELLNQALLYERDNVPSITGFLARVQSEAVEIKRSAATGDDLIRVMTVHGAKGLERPIVILPDTTSQGSSRPDNMIVGEDGTAYAYVPSKRARRRSRMRRTGKRPPRWRNEQAALRCDDPCGKLADRGGGPTQAGCKDAELVQGHRRGDEAGRGGALRHTRRHAAA